MPMPANFPRSSGGAHLLNRADGAGIATPFQVDLVR